MNMKEYHQKVKEILPGGVHYNFNMPWEEIPIHFADSKGSRVFDMDGKEYLDLYARFGAMILGHRNPEYMEALEEAQGVMCLGHCNYDYEALELVNQYVPSAEMVRFGLSGSEMVQLALRLARAYTGKNKFVRFENHYHGSYDNIMGGRSTYPKGYIAEEFFGDLKGTAGRAKDIFKDQSYLIPWNNVAALEETLENNDDIACIITEAVSVNGGSIMPAEGFLEKVRELCNEYGIVLIFDEMITGFRLGLGGAQEYFGVTPDLTTLGKALSGGAVPVSAVAGKREIMELLAKKKVAFPGTYNGYPLGTAAVKASLEILGRDNGACYREMNQRIERIHRALLSAAEKVDIGMVIQGPTACASYHCVSEEITDPKAYDFEVMIKDIIVNTSLQNHGLLVSTISRIFPNISLTDIDCEFFEDRVDSALEEAKEILEDIN